MNVQHNEFYDILPCPFCAGPGALHTGGTWFGFVCETKHAGIPCPGGGHGLFHKTERAAALAWNTRNDPDALPAPAALDDIGPMGYVAHSVHAQLTCIGLSVCTTITEHIAFPDDQPIYSATDLAKAFDLGFEDGRKMYERH